MSKILVTITLLFLMTTQVMAQANYIESVDDFTGEDNSHVLILGASGDEMGVTWKCYNDNLPIVVLGHSYLVGDISGHVIVRYRFDDEKPSPENKFLLLPSKKLTYFAVDSTFTQKALSSNQIMIRVVDPLDNRTLTTTFKLAGLGKELPSLKCVESLNAIQ